MARRCDICGKGRQVGHKVSHSHNKTRKVWEPNLQRVCADVDGTAERLVVCTRCLRSGLVTKRA